MSGNISAAYRLIPRGRKTILILYVAFANDGNLTRATWATSECAVLYSTWANLIKKQKSTELFVARISNRWRDNNWIVLVRANNAAIIMIARQVKQKLFSQIFRLCFGPVLLLKFFGSTGFPLTSTRWVRLTFSCHCPLSSNQRH